MATDGENENIPETAATAIVRDSTFVRFFADRTIFTRVGPDIEVAFLQLGPIHKHAFEDEDSIQYESEAVMTEVARLRISIPDLLASSMNFLRFGITSGIFKGDAIRASLDEWIQRKESEV